MDETKKKKGFRPFYVAFPIGYLLVAALFLFYMDLANVPIFVLVIGILALVGLLVGSVLLINKKMRFRLIPWGGFLFVFLFIVTSIKPFIRPYPALDYQAETTNTLTLADGPVKGLYTSDKEIEVYTGIPYAKPPVGDLRWKPTVQVTPWEEVRDCTVFAPKSMQQISNPVTDSLVDIYAQKAYYPDFGERHIQNRSEDSLYLNLYRPSHIEGKLPILVFIHGGSLMTGSSAFYAYNGESIARTGIISITITYRLGVFGYFAHPDLMKESGTTGNYGLLDQIEALKWVKRNAESFGGDPDKITIAGESAGSSSVSALCASPLAKGLFRYAIGESSSLVAPEAPHTFRKLEDGYKMAEAILREQKVDSVTALRAVKAEKLVETPFSNNAMTLDGYALTKNPYDVYLANENNEERLLNGTNLKESDAFVVPNFLFSPTNKDNIKERLTTYFSEDIANKMMEEYKDKIEKDAFSAFNEIITVYWFAHPHHYWSNVMADNGRPVYRYLFTKENGYYGTYHSGEMPYCYGNLKKGGKEFAYNDSDYALSKTMLSYWSNFVKNGDPNGEGLPQWGLYENASSPLQELGSNVGPIEDPYLGLYKIIDEYVANKKVVDKADAR